MEFRDIYNENGEIVRHRIPKGANLGDGEYIRMVEAWLVDDSGRILVQRRSFSCLIYPGYWTLTTGHVQSGEGGEEACIREVKEELGVDVTPDQLILIKRIVRAAGEHMIWDLFLVRYNTQKRRFKLAPDEVAEVRWLTPDQLRKMIKEEMIFYYPEMFDVIAKIEDMAFC
jgi:Isopentenyldiphosphate isomerase